MDLAFIVFLILMCYYVIHMFFTAMYVDCVIGGLGSRRHNHANRMIWLGPLAWPYGLWRLIYDRIKR